MLFYCAFFTLIFVYAKVKKLCSGMSNYVNYNITRCNFFALGVFGTRVFPSVLREINCGLLIGCSVIVNIFTIQEKDKVC